MAKVNKILEGCVDCGYGFVSHHTPTVISRAGWSIYSPALFQHTQQSKITATLSIPAPTHL